MAAQDPYGRKFCRFRKALPQPVVDAEGTPLNVEEVAAHEMFQASGAIDKDLRQLQEQTGAAMLHLTPEQAIAGDFPAGSSDSTDSSPA